MTRRRASILRWAACAAAALAIAGCTTTENTSGLEAQLADATAESAALAEHLEAANADLSSATVALETAQSETAEVVADLTAAQDDTSRLTSQVEDLNSQIETKDGEIRTIEDELKKSQDETQALMLAYDDDLAAARDEVTRAATDFACAYGTRLFEAGGASSSISSGAVLIAFPASDEYSALVANSASAASLVDLVSDPEDALNGSAEDVLLPPAVACWQALDEKANAALYKHQSVFAEAVLDAACTHGSSYAYDDYRRTSVYQSWRLDVGEDADVEYRNLVKDRYGSLEAFLAIPTTDIEAESSRCDDIRELINPKGPSTWNVGDEIQPGTWKAYDESDCYWARLAVNGDIRANHFGDALRLTVNVSASDGQFEISGCRFYFANP